MTTTATRTVTLPVTLAGSTRPVEFSLLGCDDTRAWNHGTFVARVGRGTKTHNVSVMATRADEAQLKAWGYRRQQFGQPGNLVEDETGATWGVQLRGVVLNRQATVTGWAEDAAATSRHIME